MREIKFRAWNKKKKIMVYNDEDGSACYWDGVYSSDIEMINNIFSSQDMFKSYDFMQYIGLKDKNGTEIYEGDIVKYFYDKLAVIKWRNGGFIIESKTCWASCHDICGELEVVGNIWEDGDLLNDSENTEKY